MKYVVLIMDGAAGLPIIEYNRKTSLELANTPNLDRMARQGKVGLIRTVPDGMEPSSACACMTILGYDPTLYYQGRAAIEAAGMGITIQDDEVVFRCNLVSISDGKMSDYSSGHISTHEAKDLIASLNMNLGNDQVQFFSGVSYRNICKIKGCEEVLQAECTPPHDISGRCITNFLPMGRGSEILRDLMKRSEEVLSRHPVNTTRRDRGETTATSIWLFWGSRKNLEMPSFEDIFGIKAVMTSGVDLLRGLAQLVNIDMLSIPGVTGDLDNDYVAQVIEGMAALSAYDLLIIHVEAPDEAGHAGSIDEKIEAIERIDSEMIGRLQEYTDYCPDKLKLLIMPDHPTPITVRTHISIPVPFLLWGSGFSSNGAKRLTESEAQKTSLLLDPGYIIMSNLIGNT